MSNTIYGKEARHILKKGVDYLAKAVEVTLGPRGKNVVLFDDYGVPYLTKDGVSVAKKVKSDDPLISIGVDMVREVAINTANEVGDATTTSTILAKAILDQGLIAIDTGKNPIFVKQGMDEAVSYIIQEIDAATEKVNTPEKLMQVATISANNDASIGEIAVQAVLKAGEFGIIKIEESPTYDTYIEVRDGFRIKRGYASSYFITDRQTNEAKYKECLLCLADRDINSTDDIVPILKKAMSCNQPIVIIANDFSNKVMDMMVNNHFHQKVQVLAIKTPGFGEGRSSLLDDIAALTGIEVWKEKVAWDENKYCKMVGEVISNIENTTIFSNDTPKSLNKYVNKLKSTLDKTKDDLNKNIIQERLAMLTSGITTVYVGAPSELEMREKKDRVEDAICATRVALEEGIVPGGGSVFMRIYNSHIKYHSTPEKEAGFYAVIKALKVPFMQLAKNANYNPRGNFYAEYGFDFKDLEWCDLKEKGIIDPSKALKIAIKNAVSITSMILSTECIVTN